MPEGMGGSPAKDKTIRERVGYQESKDKRGPLSRLKDLGGVFSSEAEAAPAKKEPLAAEPEATPEKLDLVPDADKKEEAPPVESFEEYEQKAKEFNSRLADLDKSDAVWLRERYDQLNKAKDEARKLYEKDRTRAEWGEIANIVGQAFVKLAAAHEGMTTGRDISSGVPFNKQNWDRTYSRIMDDYRTQLSDLKAEAAQDKDVRGAQTKTEKEGVRRQYQAAVRDLTKSKQDAMRKRQQLMAEEKDKDKLAGKIEKERQKVLGTYKQIDDILFDVEEDRMDLDKAIPKIRKLSGAEAADLEETGEKRGWLGWMAGEEDAVTKLRNYMNKRKQLQLQGLGGNAGPQPTKTTDKTRRAVANPDEIPEV